MAPRSSRHFVVAIKYGLQASTRVWLGLIATIILGSCSWKSSPQPSTLVIFVENLGFGAFSCSEGTESDRTSGFQVFCNEGVRFTHAYTTSTMSQAAIASVFTAKYPYEHGVRTNGAQTLPAKFETVAEAALSKGLRTSFFSGGPPIWRRSGLSQGFEIFDDGFGVSLKSLYRPAPELVRLYLNWRENEAAQERSLGFIYLNDLQFADVATYNELGEVRESSFSSQLEAIDEALRALVTQLKRKKLWDVTDIFLVGLQAEPSEETRPDEIPALNLLSESTRVTLMVKPARKARDGAVYYNWKIDANVSLIDVGATLFDLIGVDKLKLAAAESLRPAMSGPQADLPNDRMIVAESAWGEWRGFGGIRSAVRRGPIIFIHDELPQIYNTLTDTLETSPLPPVELATQAMQPRFIEFLKSKGFQPWRPPNRAAVETYYIGRELWQNRQPSVETIERLRRATRRFPGETRLAEWRADWDLRSSDWADLKTLGENSKRSDWVYVANRNLGLKAVVPDGPCFEFLKAGSKTEISKDCRAEGLSDLLSWASESSTENVRNKSMDQFIRFYLSKQLASRVAEQNFASGYKWDSLGIQNRPDLVELILALPEFKKFRAIAKAKVTGERK